MEAKAGAFTYGGAKPELRIPTLCEEERARRYPSLAIILGN